MAEKTYDELVKMVNELLVADDLTEWEYDYVSQMGEKIIARETFTGPEADKITEIHNRNSDKL